MSSLFVAFCSLVASSFRTRAALQAEILALRHQLTVLQKNAPLRLRLQRSDRFLWIVLSRWWPGWRSSLHIVRPDTVIAWHRRAFAWYWARKSRRRPGRPNVAAEIRHLIRDMSEANPLWGAPRIHGELLKLGNRSRTIDRGHDGEPNCRGESQRPTPRRNCELKSFLKLPRLGVTLPVTRQ
jgi:hypothetical protein